jgi:hypothetical protein
MLEQLLLNAVRVTSTTDIILGKSSMCHQSWTTSVGIEHVVEWMGIGTVREP